MSSDTKKRAAMANVLKLSFFATLGIGVTLVALIVLGIITTGIAIGIFGVLVVGMLVMHGGSMEFVSGISDTEGQEREMEEHEQWKQEQAELGYHHDDEHHEEHDEHHEEHDEGSHEEHYEDHHEEHQDEEDEHNY